MSELLLSLPYYTSICDCCTHLDIIFGYPTLQVFECKQTNITFTVEYEDKLDFKEKRKKLLEKVNGNTKYCKHFEYIYSAPFARLYLIWDVGVLL